MATTSIDVGLLLRRHVRIQLELNELQYTEHKGLLSSVFVVHGTERQMDNVNAWVRRLRQALEDKK